MSQQVSILGPEWREIRARIAGQLSAGYDALGVEHNELESLETSPYLTDFEDFYRKKIALGKLTEEQVDLKIEQAVLTRGITRSEADHMKRHIRARPPTAEEIDVAFQEEVEKEERKQQEAIDKAMREQEEAIEKAEKAEVALGRAEEEAERTAMLLAGRKITVRKRTLVIGKNGQLFVFRSGHRGRLPRGRYQRSVERNLVKLGWAPRVEQQKAKLEEMQTGLGVYTRLAEQPTASIADILTARRLRRSLARRTEA